MARSSHHAPEWLATVEDIGQIYGWWLGEVELTFDPLSTLPLSVYPWREAPTMPLPRVAGDCKTGSTLPLSVYPWREAPTIPLPRVALSVYPWREDSHHAIAQSGWRLWRDIGQIYGWWLGEVELTFDPSFYPSLVRISMARPCPYIHGEKLPPCPRVAGDCGGYRTNIWMVAG